MSFEARQKDWAAQNDKKPSFYAWDQLQTDGIWIWGRIDFPETIIETAVLGNANRQYCNCRNRQKPCKHQVSIVQVFVENPSLFVLCEAQPPWLLRKTKRLKALAEQVYSPDQPWANEERLMQIKQGAAILELWMEDSLRNGLANLVQQPLQLEHLKSRLSDYKLTGPVQQISNWQIDYFGQGTTATYALMHLFSAWLMLCRGLQSFEHQTPAFQVELLQFAGVNFAKQRVIQTGETISGTFFTVLQVIHKSKSGQPFRMVETYVWAMLQQRFAWVVAFLMPGERANPLTATGYQYQANLYFYEGLSPFRAIVESVLPVAAPVLLKPQKGYSDLLALQSDWSVLVGQNPLQPRLLVWLEGRLQEGISGWVLTDAQGAELKISLHGSAKIEPDPNFNLRRFAALVTGEGVVLLFQLAV